MQYKRHIEKFLETLPQTFSIFSEAPAFTPAPEVKLVKRSSRPSLKLKSLYAEVEQHIQQAAKEEGLSADSKEMQMLQGVLNTFNDVGLIVEKQSKKEVPKEQIIDEVKNVIKRDVEIIAKNYDAR